MSPTSRRCCLAWLTLMLVLAVGIRAASAQALDAQEAASLRNEVGERFEIVPLARGIGLVPRASRGLVEIDDGVVSMEGRSLSGAELRERFGADATLLLRLSYLSNEDLRRLLSPAPEPPAPVPPPSAPAPSVMPEPSQPAPVPSPPSPPAVEAPPSAPSAPEVSRVYRRTGARLGIGRSVTIAEDEEVTDGVVVIGGRLTVHGRVRDEIVVVGGNVELAPTADVRGDITVIGGAVERAPGARFSGRVNDAAFGDWGGRWGGWWPRVEFGGWLSLAGAVTRITLLALCVALVLLIARRPVLRVGEAAAAAPWQSVLLGFGAQILFVPLLIVGAVALAVTIIGIPFVAVLVPLAVVLAFVALLLGFTGMAARLGGWISDRASGAGQGSLLLATWLGVGLIVLPSLLGRLFGVASGPFHYVALSLLIAGAIIEYLAWTMGLGAALLTGFGRWSTVPPPVPQEPAAEA